MRLPRLGESSSCRSAKSCFCVYFGGIFLGLEKRNRYPVLGNRYPALRNRYPALGNRYPALGKHNFNALCFIDWRKNGRLILNPDLPLEFFSTNNY